MGIKNRKIHLNLENISLFELKLIGLTKLNKDEPFIYPFLVLYASILERIKVYVRIWG